MARESERKALGRKIQNAWTVMQTDAAFPAPATLDAYNRNSEITGMMLRLWIMETGNRQTRTLRNHYSENRAEYMPETLDAFLDTFCMVTDEYGETWRPRRMAAGNIGMESTTTGEIREWADGRDMTGPEMIAFYASLDDAGEMHAHGTTETTARMIDGKMTFPSGRTVDDLWNETPSPNWVCDTCGTQLDNAYDAYCSDECMRIGDETETMNHRRSCRYCGAEYCSVGTPLYCSAGCACYEDGDCCDEDWYETLCETCQNNATATETETETKMRIFIVSGTYDDVSDVGLYTKSVHATLGSVYRAYPDVINAGTFEDMENDTESTWDWLRHAQRNNLDVVLSYPMHTDR